MIKTEMYSPNAMAKLFKSTKYAIHLSLWLAIVFLRGAESTRTVEGRTFLGFRYLVDDPTSSFPGRINPDYHHSFIRSSRRVSDQLSGFVVQAKQYWRRSDELFDDILGVNGLLCNVEENSDSSAEFSKRLNNN
jgi:hypothetical protein